MTSTADTLEQHKLTHIHKTIDRIGEKKPGPIYKHMGGGEAGMQAVHALQNLLKVR